MKQLNQAILSTLGNNGFLSVFYYASCVSKGGPSLWDENLVKQIVVFWAYSLANQEGILLKAQH